MYVLYIFRREEGAANFITPTSSTEDKMDSNKFPEYFPSDDEDADLVKDKILVSPLERGGKLPADVDSTMKTTKNVEVHVTNHSDMKKEGREKREREMQCSSENEEGQIYLSIKRILSCVRNIADKIDTTNILLRQLTNSFQSYQVNLPYGTPATSMAPPASPSTPSTTSSMEEEFMFAFPMPDD
jgi:hypothetical protein